jgi:hypothetical protein
MEIENHSCAKGFFDALNSLGLEVFFAVVAG